MAKWAEINCPRCAELEAKLRKSALQELSALGQASEAYQAQLAAEAKLKWVLEERDTTFALMLKRAETAEAKLAQQDDLVQAAVAAALREAANACVNEYLDDPQGTKSDTAYQHAVADCVTAVLAIIPKGGE